jgi:predicted tellurium resistance membrane protein TerC
MLLNGPLVKIKKTENKPITCKIEEELMNLIELLFIIVCLWILYIGISFAFQDIREAEKELEEVKKQLNQEREG